MKKSLLLTLICFISLVCYSAVDNTKKLFRPISEDAIMDVVLDNDDIIKDYHFYKDEWYQTTKQDEAKLLINGRSTKEEVKKGTQYLAKSSQKAEINGHEPLDSINISIHHDSLRNLDTMFLSIYVADTSIHEIKFINQTRSVVLDTIKINIDSATTISRVYLCTPLKYTLADLQECIYRISTPGRLCSWIDGKNIEVIVLNNAEPKVSDKKTTNNHKIKEWLINSKSYPYWSILVAGLIFTIMLVCIIILVVRLNKKAKSQPITTTNGTGNIIITDPDPNDNKEIARLNGIIADLKEKQKTIKEEVEADAQKTLDEAQQKWNQEKEKIQKAEEEKLAKKEKEIENIKYDYQGKLDKKDKEINNIKDDLKVEKDKVKSIREEVIAEKKKEIDGLNEKLDTANEDLRTTKKDLNSTKATLEETKNNLSNANDQIEYLQESQRQYAEKITFAPYAEAYSNQIKELFDIEHNINEGVIKLSKKGLEDPYHLFKATHRFKTGLAEIDMEKFQVEVEMAAKKQMTFTGNGIAHLATLKGDELEKQVRMYFVLNYLAKYISALQIYNESLIGLEKLMDDVKDADVAQFIQARKQLESLYEAMKIKVICPHLFDSIGNNMDLRVEQVDAGFDSGDILEIMNCLVYAVDGQKPTDKIFVKAQQ